MNIQTDSIRFSGKSTLFGTLGKKRKNATLPLQQPDTFTRTMPADEMDFKSIRLGRFLNQGRDAEVYKTSNENYVLRIRYGHTFKPEKLIPVRDENGLIVAANKDNTVQLQKYVKGEPLYGKNWDIMCCDITKGEYFETFNKIKNLPDESFAEFIRNIINIRKSGYDIDSINPNNVLLDGTHLNIVDIDKKRNVEPAIYIGDFDVLVNLFHISNILSAMNTQEINSFADEIKILYDRIMSIAKKEGYGLDIELAPYSPVYQLYFKEWDKLRPYIENK